MKPFVVLVKVKDLNTQEIEIALRSFALLVAKVTPKHRKALRLRLIENNQQRLLVQQLLQEFKLVPYVELVSANRYDYLQDCKLLLYPTLYPENTFLLRCLAAGLPVLTYAGSSCEHYIDTSCGILVPYRTGERAVQIFYDYLRILYFDPAAQRFLRKGAIRSSNRQSMLIPQPALSLAS